MVGLAEENEAALAASREELESYRAEAKALAAQAVEAQAKFEEGERRLQEAREALLARELAVAEAEARSREGLLLAEERLKKAAPFHKPDIACSHDKPVASQSPNNFLDQQAIVCRGCL